MSLTKWQQAFIEEHKLTHSYIASVMPLVSHLKVTQTPFCLAISGSQGSGKSTLAAFFAAYLTHQLHLNSVVISLDDYYLSKQERSEKAALEHPLFATRGVPGTHHLSALINDIKSLLGGNKTQVRRFNKALDEPNLNAQTIAQGTQVVILEGWCLAVPAQSRDALICAVNDFEQINDSDGKFRQIVNDYLQQYSALEQLINQLLYINTVEFSRVLAWRIQQEHQLIEKAGRGMSDEQIAAFIPFFERITCHGFTTLPNKADICITLADNHSIAAISVNQE